MRTTIAVSGDSILNRRVSQSPIDGFTEYFDHFRHADVGFTHLETNLLDYSDPHVFPAAEAGGTWQRSPPETANDLDWLGMDVVSHASNHALDFGYGGLESTWHALDSARVKYAGTGRDLGEARSPTYLETAGGRVGIVSMTSTFPRWSRAGEARRDLQGRPGVNPLRFHYSTDSSTLESIFSLVEQFGWWITSPRDEEWVIHPPGVHNSGITIRESTEQSTVPHQGDLDGNKRAIRDAATRAEVVIGHLHTHEFNPAGHIDDPAAFVKTAARECIDAGADLFVAQGSHSPLRGIELYDGRPIFYDPGDLFRMSDLVSRLPTDFYEQYADRLPGHHADATPSEGMKARKGGGATGTESGYSGVRYPPGGYHSGSVMGQIVPVCRFDNGDVTGIELYPGRFIDDPRPSEVGIPVRAEGEVASRIIDEVAEKSAGFGTTITYEAGHGIVEV